VLTYYDESLPARIELSAISFDNWVAKAANLLLLDLDVEPGDAICLDLSGNWLLPVWAAAVWGVGGVVALPRSDAAAAAAVQIVSEDRFDRRPLDQPHSSFEPQSAVAGWTQPRSSSPEILVVSTSPLGAPLGVACPAGTIDALAELPGQPDVATLVAPDPAATILATGSESLTAEAAMDRARALADVVSTRIAVTTGKSAEADFFATVLIPLALAASTVLVVGAAPDRMAAIALAERADELHL
jgi:uncharacterized protein (TIGR03089 family)